MTMTSNEFIKSQINVLVQKYSHIKCTYEFDGFSGSHYVEILPKEYYQLNDDFLKDEMELVQNFIANFPYETLTFITEGDLYTIENPCFVLSGNDFEKQSIEFSFNQIQDNNPLLSFYKLENSLVNFGHHTFSYTYPELPELPELKDWISLKFKLNGNEPTQIQIPVQNSGYEAGEINYAGAA